MAANCGRLYEQLVQRPQVSEPGLPDLGESAYGKGMVGVAPSYLGRDDIGQAGLRGRIVNLPWDRAMDAVSSLQEKSGLSTYQGTFVRYLWPVLATFPDPSWRRTLAHLSQKKRFGTERKKERSANTCILI